MEEFIRMKLNSLEVKEGIKILYACESGSRTWGFASETSDYDVRFLYIHRLEWYLSIDEGHDVLEIPISEKLDLSGWDIRKALKLFRKSNPSMLEWLTADIVYHKVEPFFSRLVQLESSVFSERASLHHYLNMAKTNEVVWLKGDKRDIKQYFNILRPILCCLWIIENKTVPVSKFQELMTCLPQGQVYDKLLKLLEMRKATDARQKDVPETLSVHQFIQKAFIQIEAYIQTINEEKSNVTEELNHLFRVTLEEVWER